MFTRIRGLQDEAEMAYNRLSSEQADGYLQASLIAEIALQLGKLNEQQEKHIEQIDTQNALILRLCLAVESLNTGR